MMLTQQAYQQGNIPMAGTIRRKITQKAVEGAKADPSRRYFIWDPHIVGFGLLVLPSGVKSYVYQYRNEQGDSRRITIGKHGSWTADEARARAERYRDDLKGGADPLNEKAAARSALTVGEVLDLYLQSARFLEKADSTQAIDKGRVERHLRPTFGKTYAEQLTSEAVRRAFNAIRDGKTATQLKTKARGLARVTGGAGTARKAIRLLRAALRWAMEENLLPRLRKNPCDGLELGSDGERDTIIEDAVGYQRLFAVMDQMVADKRLRAPVADAIRLIALTGARRSEVAGLRWSHVDLDGTRLVLPPSSHKTGRRTGRSRVIGLSKLAWAIVDRQPRGEGGELVFAPTKGEGLVNLSKPWRNIRVEAKLPQGIGLHGLRHSLASHMAMQGAAAPELMVVLGHRQLSTTTRYLHWAEKAHTALAERATAIVVSGD